MTAAKGMFFGGLLGIPLGILASLGTYRMGQSTYRRRLETPGEVYIGPKGIYQEGSYSAWAGSGLKLNQAKLERGQPSVLRLEIKDSRGRTTYQEMRVAVPRGREPEAEELVQRLSSPR